MNRWAGKVAIVTGASAGIGTAIVKSLVEHGVKVVGLARRLDKLRELLTEFGEDKFYPARCDVTKEEDILNAFKWIETKFGSADILINNAGIIHQAMIIDMPTEEYRTLINTNLIAPAIFAREFVQSFKKESRPGHIININSIAGQFAESIKIPLGMYGPSKYALRALGTELRHEIIDTKLPIKLTNVSPGLVMTDMAKHLFSSKTFLNKMPALESKDIADAVIYALGTPDSVEIIEVTVMPKNTTISTA